MGLLLTELVKAKNSNKDSILYVIQKFEKPIKFFSYKLDYDGAESDLIIFLIEFCKKINIKKIYNLNEGAIVNYIYSSIYHEYIRLSKKNKIIQRHEKIEDIDGIDYLNYNNNMELHTLLINDSVLELIECLTKKQQAIIIYIYIMGYNDAEVAKKLGISRQAVCNIKHSALKKIEAKINKPS